MGPKSVGGQLQPDRVPADLPTLDTWPGGAGAFYVAIAVREISGRRLLAT